MFYFKLCAVTRFNSETLSNEKVYYVGVFKLMSSVNAYHDQIIKKTEIFTTAAGAKLAASLDLFGV